ncbi:hypothetical protein HYQ44_009164 [Verticillium longisporum]|nr:hypothetical protein HYQ44_009164 [Verticillium longisporum]
MKSRIRLFFDNPVMRIETLIHSSPGLSPFFAVRDFLGKAGVARNAARGMHMCCAVGACCGDRSLSPRVRDVVLLSIVDHMARTTGNGAARPGTGDLPVPSGNSPPTRVLPLGGGTVSGQGGCGVRGGRTVMVNLRSKVQNGRWKSRRDSEHMHLDLHRRAGQLRKVKGRAVRDACSSPAMADGRCWQS